MSSPSILIIDDDQELGQMLTEYLEGEAFQVAVVTDGQQAMQRLAAERFDLVILDVMLPHLNGFDVLKRLRETRATPVIMLAARGEDVDCVLGLELGADDYLAKPFNPRQLIARIRAVLRRGSQHHPEGHPYLQVGILLLDRSRHVVSIGGAELAVTGAEFKLLEALMQEVGEVRSRAVLTERVLGRPLSAYDRSIDTHVSNLRRKLASYGVAVPEIRNVRGDGYLLAASAEGSS